MISKLLRALRGQVRGDCYRGSALLTKMKERYGLSNHSNQQRNEENCPEYWHRDKN